MGLLLSFIVFRNGFIEEVAGNLIHVAAVDCILGSLIGTLSAIALAQFEVFEAEVVKASSNVPDVGLAWVGNLAVFVASLLRGRLDLEIGARDVLATNKGHELKEINGFGLTRCTRKCENEKEHGNDVVVMLSGHTPSYSMKQFMKYIWHSHGVDSIGLNFLPSGSAPFHAELFLCQCIAFQTAEEITTMFALRMPSTLKDSNSWCLLPSSKCLTNGCHEYKQDLLHVTENEAESPAAVCEMIHHISSISKENSCICIPVLLAGSDDWTKQSKNCQESVLQVEAIKCYKLMEGFFFTLGVVGMI